MTKFAALKNNDMIQLPISFTEMASTLPGIDSREFIDSMESPASVGIRINPAKLKDAGETGYTHTTPVVWNNEGYYLEERPLFTLNPLLHAGAFYVQDPSSMVYGELITKALDILQPERRDTPRVLDLCASPGGKTTAMIARLPKEGVMVANEYVEKRVGALRENLAKWGHAATIICNSDSASFADAGEVFDIVGVDAPCSGEGMMRKDEDARAQWSETLVRQCSSLQREILANACRCLRPGGILIFSTCTFNLMENEDNLAFLVEEQGLLPVNTGLAGTGGILPQLAGDYPALRFMPHSTRGEGLFVAMLRKPENEDYDSSITTFGAGGKKGKKGMDRKRGKGNDGKDVTTLAQWLDKDTDWIINEEGGFIEAIPRVAAETAAMLEGFVRIIGKGVRIAERKGRDFAPSSELALCTLRNPDSFPSHEIDKDTALSYLRGESLHIPDAPKGYVTLTYCGVPIGMVKNLGTRANNLWPSRWKIRHV